MFGLGRCASWFSNQVGVKLQFVMCHANNMHISHIIQLNTFVY